MIGCVGQRSGGDREATGRENVRLQGQLYGLRGRDLSARVDELLAQSGWRKRPTGSCARTPAGCSGGSTSRWRSSIGPQVLFLDEPTTGLDPEVRMDMWREIERLTREQG